MKSKMKICYLADACSPHTRKWCNFFTARGYTVCVISFIDAIFPGVTVYSLGMSSLFEKTDIQKLNYLKCVCKIRQILKFERPDILHAHYATSYGLLGALCNYRPFLVSVWGTDVFEFPRKGIFHRMVFSFITKRADVILSTSKAMAKEIENYSNKKIEITPFGVDIEKYQPIQVIRYHEFTVGTIKSLYRQYGIEYLIRGFRLFLDHVGHNSARLIIAGKGDQETYLKQLANGLGIMDKVDFLGYLDEDEVINTLNKLDVAVFPSIYESFGVAAVEAQACGIPTVVTNIGGLMESTAPGYSSIIVEKQNEFKIAEALLNLYQNEDKLKQMKINARNFVIQNFNINENLYNAEKIYQNINHNSKTRDKNA